MRILAFGTYQVENHPRVAVLADGLARAGHEVAEANVRLGLSTAERVALLGRRTGALRLGLRLVRAWARLAVRARREARRSRPDVVLVGYLGHFDVWLARLLFPRTVVVLDHLVFAASTAADRGASGSFLQRALRLLDRGAIARADVVVVDTAEHGEMVPASARSKVVVVPVGATDAWFDAASPESGDESGDRLSVVFFGLFTPLQGSVVIGEAAALLADAPVDLTMIGSGQDLAAARAAAGASSSVTWVPWVEARDLPAVVARHQVGLGVFGTTDKALKVVPNKVYQCAAAGVAVVTSDTRPQRRALADAAVFVPAGDARALADALLGLQRDAALLRRHRDAARRAADERFRPETSVAPLAERLSTTVRPRSRRSSRSPGGR